MFIFQYCEIPERYLFKIKNNLHLPSKFPQQLHVALHYDQLLHFGTVQQSSSPPTVLLLAPTGVLYTIVRQYISSGTAVTRRNEYFADTMQN